MYIQLLPSVDFSLQINLFSAFPNTVIRKQAVRKWFAIVADIYSSGVGFLQACGMVFSECFVTVRKQVKRIEKERKT